MIVACMVQTCPSLFHKLDIAVFRKALRSGLMMRSKKRSLVNAAPLDDHVGISVNLGVYKRQEIIDVVVSVGLAVDPSIFLKVEQHGLAEAVSARMILQLKCVF